MSKAILVIDMPSGCSYCDFCRTKDYDYRYKIDGDKYCCIKELNVNDYYYDEKPIGKPNWCPLKPLPEKSTTGKSYYYQWGDWEDGWNACIDYILSKENKT